jgi:hypothetical protein
VTSGAGSGYALEHQTFLSIYLGLLSSCMEHTNNDTVPVSSGAETMGVKNNWSLSVRN